MKTLGLVLLIAGIAMIVIRGFSVQTEKKVVDLGPVEINKKENRGKIDLFRDTTYKCSR